MKRRRYEIKFSNNKWVAVLQLLKYIIDTHFVYFVILAMLGLIYLIVWTGFDFKKGEYHIKTDGMDLQLKR